MVRRGCGVVVVVGEGERRVGRGVAGEEKEEGEGEECEGGDFNGGRGFNDVHGYQFHDGRRMEVGDVREKKMIDD